MTSPRGEQKKVKAAQRALMAGATVRVRAAAELAGLSVGKRSQECGK